MIDAISRAKLWTLAFSTGFDRVPQARNGSLRGDGIPYVERNIEVPSGLAGGGSSIVSPIRRNYPRSMIPMLPHRIRQARKFSESIGAQIARCLWIRTPLIAT